VADFGAIWDPKAHFGLILGQFGILKVILGRFWADFGEIWDPKGDFGLILDDLGS